MDEAAMAALAKRFFDAIEAADVATLKEIYAPDAVLWSNVTGTCVRAGDLLGVLPAMAKRMPDRRYGERQVDCHDGGFTHRHRVTGTTREGGRAAMAAACVVTVADGRVTRVDEYCDARQLKAVFG